MSERLRIAAPAHAALLARFYDELYLPAFAHQREPLDAWQSQLWGDAPAPFELTITLAGDSLADPDQARIDGGIVGERYPRSRCAILTYMVVAPHARRGGLGRTLLDDAREALRGRTRAVFGEVSDPALARSEDEATTARARLDRFLRWGARVIEQPYVQPCLGPGLARDRALRLIAFFDEPAPASLPGDVLRDFLREFYAVTERLEPTADPELGPLLAGIPDQVAVRRM